jgi:phage terminase small subunit
MPNSNRPGPSAGGTGKKVVTRGSDAAGTGKKVITRGPNRQLTRRQEKFVKELVSNDGLITMREAATRAGYPPASAHSRAYELTNNNICPHVVAEIKRYRDELDEQYGITYQRHLAAMGRIKNLALENHAYSAAVMAEKSRGLAAGLYVSKSEIRTGSIDSMNREQVEAALDQLRSTFEPIIDITPTEVEEPDAEGGAEESGSGPVATDIGRAEEDGAKD